MYSRDQLFKMFAGDPPLTDAHLDTLEAIQEAGADHGAQGYYPDGDFSSDADWCYGVGDLITRLEAELEIDDGTVFDLYLEAHSESFNDGTINPGERDWFPTIWDFQFGAYGDTRCSVHADSVDAALELAADWLRDNAPGHLMLHGHGNDTRDPQLDSMMAEKCEEIGLTWPIPEGTTDFQPYWDAEQAAYADLTYTEAGYLTSYEWWVNERN